MLRTISFTAMRDNRDGVVCCEKFCRPWVFIMLKRSVGPFKKPRALMFSSAGPRRTVHFHSRANVNYKFVCLVVGGYGKRGPTTSKFLAFLFNRLQLKAGLYFSCERARSLVREGERGSDFIEEKMERIERWREGEKERESESGIQFCSSCTKRMTQIIRQKCIYDLGRPLIFYFVGALALTVSRVSLARMQFSGQCSCRQTRTGFDNCFQFHLIGSWYVHESWNAYESGAV